jgi:ABC-type Mn2+/Zn2+ transport system permease subunit
MNTNHDNISAPTPLSAADEHALQTIGRHQRRLKWLTITAIAFWALAVFGTIGVLVCYSLFVAPKERQIMADYGMHGRLVSRSAPPSSEPPTNADRALGVNFTMTYVVTKGILIVAISVVVLSLGTLATLILTIFSRRVTLQQINHSLAQISQQLRELRGV